MKKNDESGCIMIQNLHGLYSKHLLIFFLLIMSTVCSFYWFFHLPSLIIARLYVHEIFWIAVYLMSDVFFILFPLIVGMSLMYFFSILQRRESHFNHLTKNIKIFLSAWSISLVSIFLCFSIVLLPRVNDYFRLVQTHAFRYLDFAESPFRARTLHRLDGGAIFYYHSKTKTSQLQNQLNSVVLTTHMIFGRVQIYAGDLRFNFYDGKNIHMRSHGLSIFMKPTLCPNFSFHCDEIDVSTKFSHKPINLGIVYLYRDNIWDMAFFNVATDHIDSSAYSLQKKTIHVTPSSFTKEQIKFFQFFRVLWPFSILTHMEWCRVFISVAQSFNKWTIFWPLGGVIIFVYHFVVLLLCVLCFLFFSKAILFSLLFLLISPYVLRRFIFRKTK